MYVYFYTVELGYNELGYNELPVITNRFACFGWFWVSLGHTFPAYNEQNPGYNELFWSVF